MNFFRKSSMILAGAAAAGLLAFACAGNDASSSSSADEVIQSSTNDLLIAKVYAGGGAANGLGGDYVEIFNPTAKPISRKLLSLQLADADGAFSRGYAISLADPKDDEAVIESGHYFLVSLKKGADLGGITPSIEASPVVLADGGAPVDFALNITGGSVALVNSEDLLDCDQPQNCMNLPGVKSVFGYGTIADSAPLSEKKPFAALTTSTAAIRKLGGCYATGSSAADFESGEAKPFDPANGLNCSTAAADGGTDAGLDASADDDGGTDAGETDAGKTDAGKTDAGKTDAGKTDAGKTDAGKTDAGDESEDDTGDDTADPTPAPSTGKKKKTNAVNGPPQPIATSDKSSCSAAPGPMPSSGLAGLAGLGLAIASLARRKKR